MFSFEAKHPGNVPLCIKAFQALKSLWYSHQYKSLWDGNLISHPCNLDPLYTSMVNTFEKQNFTHSKKSQLAVVYTVDFFDNFCCRFETSSVLFMSDETEERTRWRAHLLKSALAEERTRWRAHSLKSALAEERTCWRAHSLKSALTEEYTCWRVHSLKSALAEAHTRWRAHSLKSALADESTRWRARSLKSAILIWHQMWSFFAIIDWFWCQIINSGRPNQDFRCRTEPNRTELKLPKPNRTELLQILRAFFSHIFSNFSLENQ